MNAALRAFVRERAGRRCEYCRLHEDERPILVFYVEHVVAKQPVETDDSDILCFAGAYPRRLALPQQRVRRPIDRVLSRLLSMDGPRPTSAGG